MSSSTETRRFSPLASGSAPDAAQERQAARAMGYAEGWAAGQRAAAAQAEAGLAAIERQQQEQATSAQAELDRALGALAAAGRQLASTLAPVMDEIGDVVLDAAIALARTILDAELAVVDDVAEAALRRVLRPLPTDTEVTVRLHPQDHARVLQATGAAASDVVGFEGYAVRLLADSSLSRGDALAAQAGSVVDARVEASLARAQDVVRSGAWSL